MPHLSGVIGCPMASVLQVACVKNEGAARGGVRAACHSAGDLLQCSTSPFTGGLGTNFEWRNSHCRFCQQSQGPDGFVVLDWL